MNQIHSADSRTDYTFQRPTPAAAPIESIDNNPETKRGI